MVFRPLDNREVEKVPGEKADFQAAKLIRDIKIADLWGSALGLIGRKRSMGDARRDPLKKRKNSVRFKRRGIIIRI